MGQKKVKVEVKRVKCKQCDETFDLFNELKDHWKHEHVGQYQVIQRFIEETKHVGEVNEDQ